MIFLPLLVLVSSVWANKFSRGYANDGYNSRCPSNNAYYNYWKICDEPKCQQKPSFCGQDGKCADPTKGATLTYTKNGETKYLCYPKEKVCADVYALFNLWSRLLESETGTYNGVALDDDTYFRRNCLNGGECKGIEFDYDYEESRTYSRSEKKKLQLVGNEIAEGVCECINGFTGDKCEIPPPPTSAPATAEPTVPDNVGPTDICHGHSFGYQSWSQDESWGEFNQTCVSGKAQSPIDISSSAVSDDGLFMAPQLRGYSSGLLKHYGLLNNGHTLWVGLSPEDSKRIGFYLNKMENGKYNRRFYSLMQFHFHWPSEHMINHRRFDLEMHLVHVDQGTGKLAVIGVPFILTRATFMESLWINQIVKLFSNIQSPSSSVGQQPINLASFHLARDYYRYQGSLTAPPCTEGVQWFFAKYPSPISFHQFIQGFASATSCSGNLMKGNYRQPQALNGRTVGMTTIV